VNDGNSLSLHGVSPEKISTARIPRTTSPIASAAFSRASASPPSSRRRLAWRISALKDIGIQLERHEFRTSIHTVSGRAAAPG